MVIEWGDTSPSGVEMALDRSGCLSDVTDSFWAAKTGFSAF